MCGCSSIAGAPPHPVPEFPGSRATHGRTRRDACTPGLMPPPLGERRAGHRRVARAEEEDPRVPAGLELVARIVPQGGPVDAHRARTVVADAEHRTAALLGVVALDGGAGQLDR